MANTHYAWSDIKTEKETVKCGDKVTKSALGVSDEEWDELVEVGVVRTVKYPDTSKSPREHNIELFRAIAAGETPPQVETPEDAK